MADQATVRRSPLDGLALPARPGIATVTDPGPRARWNYRGDPDHIGAAFGVAPSIEPSWAVVDRDRAAIWLGPDEWLLLAPDAERPSLAAAMAAALAGKAASLVDIAHRNAALIIEGPAAARLLNTSCPLDLDLSQFPVGMCTRTLFAKAEIVLWRTAARRFHVECQRSFAPYVASMLDAGLRDLESLRRM